MILRSLRFLTTGVLFAFAATAHAQAQDPKLWYVAAGGGASFYQDMTFSGGVVGDISMDTGYTGNVAIGRYLDDIRVLRLEVEGVYARADFNNSAGFATRGDISNSSLMVNFLYDIHTGSSWVPFVGGGIGHSWVAINNLANPATGTVFIDGSDSVFAYQFKAGVAYQFNPALAATVTYRYFATNNLGFSTPTGTAKSGGVRSHNAEFGVRFNF
jgi:OOP family OmpA-OmpF porin